MEEAVRLEKEDKLDEALQLYQKAASEMPKYADVYARMGYTLRKMGYAKKADEMFDKCQKVGGLKQESPYAFDAGFSQGKWITDSMVVGAITNKQQLLKREAPASALMYSSRDAWVLLMTRPGDSVPIINGIPTVGVGSELRFDRGDWVEFLGEKYRKGGVRVMTNGPQFLEGTEKIENGEVKIQRSGTWVQEQQPPVPSGEAKQQVKAAPKPPAPGSVKIALKSAVGDMATYKITTQARRTTKWQGPVPDKAVFEENFNEERVEMVLTQRIQSLDPNGIAVALVTINGIKCRYLNKNTTSVDFDSSRSSDANNPIMKLIDQTYLVEFSPWNNISAVDALPRVMVTMKDGTPSGDAGVSILYPEAIMERHGAMQLPEPGQEMLKPGEKWSRIKTFAFGKMGLKSYEKIYTLKEVRDADGRSIVVIDMNTIPSSEVEPKYRSQQAEVDVPKTFDTNDSYTGGGEFDLKAGRIENYHEDLEASWTVALPAKQGDTGEPVVLKMSASRVYSIERVK
jgi:hypothetical protein